MLNDIHTRVKQVTRKILCFVQNKKMLKENYEIINR